MLQQSLDTEISDITIHITKYMNTLLAVLDHLDILITFPYPNSTVVTGPLPTTIRTTIETNSDNKI